MIDEGLEILSNAVSRLLGGLPDLASVDLSMANPKGKGH
jgi:hypothetical protein